MPDALNQAALQLRQQISHFVHLTDEEWAEMVPYLTLVTLQKQQ